MLLEIKIKTMGGVNSKDLLENKSANEKSEFEVKVIINEYERIKNILTKAGSGRSYDDILILKSYFLSLDFLRNLCSNMSPKQTEDLCKFAVQIYGMVLQYVKEPTEEIYRLAVEQNAYAIDFIVNPSKEVCKIAEQRNGCREYEEMRFPL